MIEFMKEHPVFNYAEDINDICLPLNKLNISYFSHVFIDKGKNFSGIGNNPRFSEHYLKNNYFNVDIHMANEDLPGRYFIWDAICSSAETDKMIQEASEFGLLHSFTITERNQNGSNFYHFSTHLKENTVNQMFLNNLDLLETFILHFKEKINQSRILMRAYDLKIPLKTDDSTSILEHNVLQHNESKRFEFLNALGLNDKLSRKFKILHKDTQELLFLAPQQTKCLELLLKDKSNKEIASALDLSPRTIEFYLGNLRKKLGCRTRNEVIRAYSNYLRNMGLFTTHPDDIGQCIVQCLD